MDVHDASTPIFFLTNELHSFSHSLTPSKRDLVVFFGFMTVFLLPVVTCAGAVSGTSGNKTDYLALLAIKSAIKDPLRSLSSWNHSVHHCNWEGIICGRRHQRVVALDLSSRGLGGTISPFVGNLSFLRSLYLYNNTLGGPIPAETGFLFRLQGLSLYQNLFVGEIPSTISNCLKLEYIDISENSLTGRIPTEFASLSMLKDLYVDTNNLTGPIFSIIQNLTSLVNISASFNAFDGIIPDTIGQMKNLYFLAVGQNLITGMLPSSIYNVSSLRVLLLHSNQLHGSLPTNIASKLPYLQVLELGVNHFTGPFPVSLSNISSLNYAEFSENKFIGRVPKDLGNLKQLEVLMIDGNYLGSGDAHDLSFLSSLVNCSNLKTLVIDANNFGGVLPNAIANLSTKLTALYLGTNCISGRIPAGMISRLFNLVLLKMDDNQLSGTVPNDIGRLQKLEQINFNMNMFTGTIPESLGNLSKLSRLHMDGNNFKGAIPSSLGNCQYLIAMHVNKNNLRGTIPKGLFGGSPHLVELVIAENYLEGPLPFEVGQQEHLTILDVSNNKLSGEIPSALGSCSSLVNLYLEGNRFHGRIPASLSSLKSIQELDLSHNNFSGPIPAYLSKFPLTNLNLSYNYFEGEVPVGGVFANASTVSLVGNPGLCGGIPELHLARCTRKEITRGKISFRLKLIISCACALVGMAIVLSCYCIYRRRKRDSSLPISSFQEPFLRVSYKMLLKATEGFSSSNLLGAGSFGSVFKGVLEQNQMIVAVKVLKLQHPGASKSFLAECKALRNVRHRNLVRVITACSSVDCQGNDFKALVYEFMHGGSLESWLYVNEQNQDGVHEVRNLSLLQRVNVVLDLAAALEYLHHECEVPIVHRDLKPSNILLDNDMVAHVGDFGLAKFLPQPSCPNQSSSVEVEGTIGYVAPEYGLGVSPSIAGDIYSYGIMVLEIMTAKRPTDDAFQEGLNLHTYVRMGLADQVVQIVDPRLLDIDGYALNSIRNPRQAATWIDCVGSVMQIGVACSLESPQDRMNLKDASVELLKVKNNLT